MVTVLLSGGLGNQMFQYAAAKSLAIRLNTALSVDLYTFSKKTQATVRPYELGIFNIEDVVETSSLKAKAVIKARPFIQRHRSFFQRFGVFTDTYAILYQPTFEALTGGVIMSGYFQNESYFKNISELLRKDFSFKYPLIGENKDVAGQISENQSVAVHIRRGII